MFCNIQAIKHRPFSIIFLRSARKTVKCLALQRKAVFPCPASPACRWDPGISTSCASGTLAQRVTPFHPFLRSDCEDVWTTKLIWWHIWQATWNFCLQVLQTADSWFFLISQVTLWRQKYQVSEIVEPPGISRKMFICFFCSLRKSWNLSKKETIQQPLAQLFFFSPTFSKTWMLMIRSRNVVNSQKWQVSGNFGNFLKLLFPRTPSTGKTESGDLIELLWVGGIPPFFGEHAPWKSVIIRITKIFYFVGDIFESPLVPKRMKWISANICIFWKVPVQQFFHPIHHSLALLLCFILLPVCKCN